MARPGEHLLALWRLARPEVWMVTFIPMYGGWVLATRDLVPGLVAWTDFWSRAARQGTTWNHFWDTLESWWPEAQPLVLGLVVMGPLLWTATLLINDVHDLAGDRQNPRKARSPLVQGLVTHGWAHGAAYVFAAASLVVAYFISTTFLIIVAAELVLAWAYSVPPVRLKSRPGADVAVNAMGVGALASLAGWSIHAPIGLFPWEFLPQALLVAVAVYVPTTLVDHDADKLRGDHTLATHLGPRKAYLVGWWAWVGANVGAIFLSWQDLYIPREMLPVLLVMGPLLLWQYHRFIGKARSGEAMVEGIVLTSLTFLCVNVLWALLYTGMWVTAGS